MGAKTDVHAVSPALARDILSRTLPFSELSPAEIARLAKKCSVDFFPKDTLLLSQGATEVDYLYIIQKGGVKLFLRDENGEENLADYRGEDATIGALALIRRSRANLSATTVEDTFLLRLPREDFVDLLERDPDITSYYLKSLSEDYVSKAYTQIRQHKVAPQTESGLYLFSTRVGDVIRKKPVTIEATASIQDAAITMAREGVGSLIVTSGDDPCTGIVTDKDFRYKVVSQGMDFSRPVSDIMAQPVLTIDSHEVCFDALLRMMKNQIHHLAIRDQTPTSAEGTKPPLAGMITSHDIMVLQGRSPFSIFKEIVVEGSYEGLYSLSHKIPLVVRTLIEEGAKASNITRMIAVLNDLILERLLTLIPQDLGPPPLAFCWLLMGSEGRREQTFRTDQDNALVYQDPGDEAERAQAEEYFQRFGETAIEHLVKCGFPRCPGDIMASNPKWRQPMNVWHAYFSRWITRPEPAEVLNATIFFDFRPGFGYFELAQDLRTATLSAAKREDVFLRILAQDCLKTRPPLSFFRGFIVEKDGEHKNRLDIKTRGITPLTDFARLMALRHGVAETNTLDRIKLLEKGGHISRELSKDIHDAYEFLMQIRLVHQLEQMEDGGEPDNHVHPDKLSDLEKRTLKDAFSVISSIQSFVKDVFRLNA